MDFNVIFYFSCFAGGLCTFSFRPVRILRPPCVHPPFRFRASSPLRLCPVTRRFPLAKSLLSGLEVTVFFSVTVIVTVIVTRAHCARVKYYNVFLLPVPFPVLVKICFVTYL